MHEDLTDPLVAGRFVVWHEGETLAVTNLYRGDLAVTDPDRAWAFVAGPRADGSWVGGSVDDWDLVPVKPA